MSRRLMLRNESAAPLQPIGENLINLDTVTLGYTLDSNGDLSPESTRRVSDFIPVYYGYTYMAKGPSNRRVILCSYDANGNFVNRREENTSISGFTPTAEETSVRVSATKTGGGGTTTFSFTRTA